MSLRQPHKRSELLQDLADNAGDAAAVREITAKLQLENEAMAASRDALVAANSALATAVQANVTTPTTSTATEPTEPASEPGEPTTPEPELSVSPMEPLRSEGNI